MFVFEVLGNLNSVNTFYDFLNSIFIDHRLWTDKVPSAHWREGLLARGTCTAPRWALVSSTKPGTRCCPVIEAIPNTNAGWMESSPEEKDMEVLVDKTMNVS